LQTYNLQVTLKNLEEIAFPASMMRSHVYETLCSNLDSTPDYCKVGERVCNGTNTYLGRDSIWKRIERRHEENMSS
jgi:hypothetical protein